MSLDTSLHWTDETAAQYRDRRISRLRQRLAGAERSLHAWRTDRVAVLHGRWGRPYYDHRLTELEAAAAALRAELDTWERSQGWAERAARCVVFTNQHGAMFALWLDEDGEVTPPPGWTVTDAPG